MRNKKEIYKEVIMKKDGSMILKRPNDGKEHEVELKHEVHSLGFTLTNITINYEYHSRSPNRLPYEFNLDNYEEKEYRKIIATGKLSRPFDGKGIYIFDDLQVDEERKISNVKRYTKPIKVILSESDKPDPSNGSMELDDSNNPSSGFQLRCDLSQQTFAELYNLIKKDDIFKIEATFRVRAYWERVSGRYNCYLHDYDNIGVYLERIQTESKRYTYNIGEQLRSIRKQIASFIFRMLALLAILYIYSLLSR